MDAAVRSLTGRPIGGQHSGGGAQGRIEPERQGRGRRWCGHFVSRGVILLVCVALVGPRAGNTGTKTNVRPGSSQTEQPPVSSSDGFRPPGHDFRHRDHECGRSSEVLERMPEKTPTPNGGRTPVHHGHVEQRPTRAGICTQVSTGPSPEAPQQKPQTPHRRIGKLVVRRRFGLLPCLQQ